MTDGHSRDPLSDDSTTGIKKEALNRVVVQRTERVRYVQPMVPGVERLVQECVHVHGAMQEILPGVDEETAESVGKSCERQVVWHSQSGEKLNEWDCPPICIINKVVCFVKPQVRGELGSNCGFEGAKDGGGNGFHPRYVHLDRDPGLCIRVHPEVSQCDLDDMLENDGDQDLPLGDPIP